MVTLFSVLDFFIACLSLSQTTHSLPASQRPGPGTTAPGSPNELLINDTSRYCIVLKDDKGNQLEVNTQNLIFGETLVPPTTYTHGQPEVHFPTTELELRTYDLSQTKFGQQAGVGRVSGRAITTGYVQACAQNSVISEAGYLLRISYAKPAA